METRATEIADGVHQLTTYVEAMDFSFNQYLITSDEPTLFHTGPRQMFPLVSAAVAKVVSPESLRWISFGHVEADECGAMNEWLAIAPHATVLQGMTGCMVSITDLADRAPQPILDGETRDVGRHVLQWFDTPHVPHAWEAGVIYDSTTRTLFCGDLFTHTGACAASSDADVIGPAIAAEDLFHYSTLARATGATLRRLAELDIATLGLMHGPAYTGDCRTALLDLADHYDKRIASV